MRETYPSRRHARLSLARWFSAIALLIGAALVLTPAPALAKAPITVQTIVSKSGSHWNAPTSPWRFFPSYIPPHDQPSRQPTSIPPEFKYRLQGTHIPGSIIGPDERQRVSDTTSFPYRAIVYLQMEFTFGIGVECSGVIIGPRTVATAGHCVYDPGLGWAERARAYPAANGAQAPFGFAEGQEFFTVQGWVDSHQAEFDYGAIELDRPLGDQTGWVGMAVLDKKQLRRLLVRVTGYPADKTPHTMWTMAGRVRRLTPLRVFYAADTSPGESGAPVYNAMPSRACSYCIIGIHGYGTSGDPKRRDNSGVRVTQEVLNNYLEWRSLPASAQRP
jgi:V8-like Glu-specific endopeptidase